MPIKRIYAEVSIDEDFKPAFAYISQHKASKVALVTNTHRTVVRVADLTGYDKRLTQVVQWRLVQENFPFGQLLNENTHIFDGGTFANSAGQKRFMMVALPKTIADSIAEMGMEKWGSAHKLERLDTIEHVLFRYYADAANKAYGKAHTDTHTENPKAQWIVFRQDMGFRILVLVDCLPHNAHYISNHNELRESELDRVWHESTPSHVLILTRVSNGDLTTDADSIWLKEYIQGKEITLDNEDYQCLSKFAAI